MKLRKLESLRHLSIIVLGLGLAQYVGRIFAAAVRRPGGRKRVQPIFGRVSRCIGIALVGLLFVTGGVAQAHRSPESCHIPGFSATFSEDKVQIVSGETVTYSATISAAHEGACDLFNLSVVLVCPAADGSPTGSSTPMASGDSISAGGSKSYSGFPCIVTVNSGVSQATARLQVEVDVHDSELADHHGSGVVQLPVTIVACETTPEEPTWFQDADGDGYGNASVTIQACEQPAGYVGNDDDCNDGDATIHPGATEACNGVDDDCDGQVDEISTWYRDSDGDGYGNPLVSTQACGEPLGYVSDNTDCDDTNADVNPGEQEVCDGVDDDCDGLVDDEDPSVIGQSTFYADDDGDGYGAGAAILACSQPANTSINNADCNDGDASINPGALEGVADGIDQNCDGSELCYQDGDADGYGSSSTVASSDLDCSDAAEASNSTDCNDASGAVNPGAAESCNGIDDDCDGSTDEGVLSTFYADGDGDGYGAGATILACSQPANTSTNNTDCNDGNASINPGASEVCDSLDNDCDGAVDEGGVCPSAPLLTSLSPARVWVGLQNNADAGIRFDLAAKVYLNDVEVGSGQLDSVAGGSSGFDNARLDTIKLSLSAPVPVPTGSSFRIEVLVRNACRRSGKNSGRAVLWYNGQPIDRGPRADAGTRFDASIGGAKRDYFLRQSAALSTTAGSSRLSVDQDAGSPCSAFKSLGTWSQTLP